MSSKLKKCCNPSNSKIFNADDDDDDVYTNAGQEPMIVRSTNFRLFLEGGTTLLAREIISEVDEIAKRKQLACLCKEPSIETSSSVTKREPKIVTNKRKAPNKNRSSMKANNWEMYQRFVRDWELLINAVVKKDTTCLRKIKKLLQPKWFHQLSPKQMTLLDQLPQSFMDDHDEGCTKRTQSTLRLLGMYPVPSLVQIRNVVRNNATNPVLFLSTLLNLSTFTKHSAVLESKGTDDCKVQEEQEEEYSWNSKLLMSAISYMEMPLLLRKIHQRVSHASWFISKPKKQASISSKAKKSSSPTPYLQPVWTVNPWNWKAERDAEEEALREERHVRCLMSCPSDISRTNHLEHIRPDVPKSSVNTPDLTEEKPKTEWCMVLEMFKDFEPEHQVPAAPPSSRTCLREFSRTTMDFLNQVSALLQPEAQEAITYKDISSCLTATLTELQEQGMICACFPHIQHYPAISQLIKHLQGEEWSTKLKASLLNNSLSATRCLKTLYVIKQLPEGKEPYRKSTWASIGTVRQKTSQQKSQFLHELNLARYKNAQYLWHTFNPNFVYKRSFLQIFYAYMVSGIDQINK